MNLPSKDSASGKAVTVALWFGLSAVAGSIIAAVAGNSSLFGPLTFLVNVAAVWVKNLADTETKNW